MRALRIAHDIEDDEAMGEIFAHMIVYVMYNAGERLEDTMTLIVRAARYIEDERDRHETLAFILHVISADEIDEGMRNRARAVYFAALDMPLDERTYSSAQGDHG